jgi:hypothetical protein
MFKNERLVLCSPCCTNCPEVFKDGDMIAITDDNDVATAGVRKIKLTKDQFKMLLQDGEKFLG